MGKYDLCCLDAGHGGTDPGACANGLKEKEVALRITLSCEKELKRNNVKTMLTRSGDSTLSLNERCKIANKAVAKDFISIHINAGGGDGAEAIHSVNYGKGTELAKAIVYEIEDYTGQNLRPRETYSKPSSSNANRDYFAVIRDTNMPATIVECGFIDNKNDHKIFDTLAEQDAMGVAIARGIMKHRGIVYDSTEIKPGNDNPSTPSDSAEIKAGDKVKIKKTAGKYYTGQVIPESQKGDKIHTVRKVDGKKVLLDEIVSWVYISDVDPIVKAFTIGSYQKKVKVHSTTGLNVRTGRGAEFSKMGSLVDGSVISIWYIDKASNGILWGSTTFQGKTGYVCMEYVKPL